MVDTEDKLMTLLVSKLNELSNRSWRRHNDWDVMMVWDTPGGTNGYIYNVRLMALDGDIDKYARGIIADMESKFSLDSRQTHKLDPRQSKPL